jgi:hypothetical protein
MWERFDAERTQEQGGDPSLAIDNRVSLSIKAGSDDHTKLLKIAAAAKRPFAVVSVPPFIPERPTSPRGSLISKAILWRKKNTRFVGQIGRLPSINFFVFSTLDFVAEDAVRSELLSDPISLLAGKFTGNIESLGSVRAYVPHVS